MNKVSISDLNPRESSFELRGKTYELKKFSLAAQVWAASAFATPENSDGLANLGQAVEKVDPVALTRVCYYLLKDKKDFPILDSFADALGTHFVVTRTLLKPFRECLGVSQPSVDDTAEELQIKK